MATIMNILEEHYNHCLISHRQVAEAHNDIMAINREYQYWWQLDDDFMIGNHGSWTVTNRLRKLFDLEYSPTNITDISDDVLSRHGIIQPRFMKIEKIIEDIIILDQIRLGLLDFYIWDHDGPKLPEVILSRFDARGRTKTCEYHVSRRSALEPIIKRYDYPYNLSSKEEFYKLFIPFNNLLTKSTHVFWYYGHKNVHTFEFTRAMEKLC